MSEIKHFTRYWTIFDGCSHHPTIQGPPIAYAETIRVVDLDAYEQMKKERDELIERINVVCEGRQAMGEAYEQLKADRQILLEALENLQNKTDVYQKVYPDDKQLRKYKEIARDAIAKAKPE